MLGVTRREIANRTKGKLQPTEETTSTGISPALAGFDRVNENVYAILCLLTEKLASLFVPRDEDESGTSRTRQKALQKLLSLIHI